MKKIITILLKIAVGTSTQNFASNKYYQSSNNSLQQVFDKYSNDSNIMNRALIPWNYQNSPVLLAKRGSINNAVNFITYAGAAYCPSNSLLNWSCNNCRGYSLGTSNVIYLWSFSTNSAGYLAVNNYNRQIIIAFRGTNDIFNWLYNIATIFSSAGLGGPYSGAEVHLGFNTMANYLYSQTQAALINAMRKFPGYQVVFTGHSLGGAVAELMAFKLAQNNIIRYEDINVYTYGQPRAGNMAFAYYVNSQPWTYTRVTNFGDVVPQLPPLNMGFVHNQYNTFINAYGQTIQCSAAQEDPNCTTPPVYTNTNAHSYYWGIYINASCN